jgi:hemerythrin
MPIQWTQDLAVGVEEIDRQHRELYANVASLHEAMRAQRLERIPGILEFLQRYALEHFEAEERHMASTGYPHLEAHRAAHRDFVASFLRHREACQGRGVRPSAVVELSDWIGRWLREHVRTVDGQMGRHLRASVPSS